MSDTPLLGDGCFTASPRFCGAWLSADAIHTLTKPTINLKITNAQIIAITRSINDLRAMTVVEVEAIEKTIKHDFTKEFSGMPCEIRGKVDAATATIHANASSSLERERDVQTGVETVCEGILSVSDKKIIEVSESITCVTGKSVTRVFTLYVKTVQAKFS